MISSSRKLGSAITSQSPTIRAGLYLYSHHGLFAASRDRYSRKRGGSVLGFVSQQFQSFVYGGVAAIGKVFRRKDGHLNIGRHAGPIEGLAVLCEVNLIRKPKCPSVG